MKLTRVERWILANQYRILEALYPEETESYAEAREALENGFESHFTLPPSFARDGEVFTKEQSDEVIDILTMFDDLEIAYMMVADKSGIDMQRMTFRGFDGTTETAYLTYARYYCHSGGGRFGNVVQGSTFNSQTPMLPRYRSMLEVWRARRRESSLTREAILAITSAPELVSGGDSGR